MPGVDEAGVMELEGAPESHPCAKLPEEDVTVCGASADPRPCSLGTEKTKAKAVSAAGKFSPRPGRRWTVSTGAETRETNHPKEQVCNIMGARRVTVTNCTRFVISWATIPIYSTMYFCIHRIGKTYYVRTKLTFSHPSENLLHILSIRQRWQRKSAAPISGIYCSTTAVERR